MLTLSVIGVEDGAIIAASDSGERFRIPVDATVKARLRDGPQPANSRRLSPREIQAHVRAGLSVQQVATLTGAPVGYIERFVGPVLAELEYVIENALAVKILSDEGDPKPRTFRAVMTERLASLAATGIKWSSCKEATGGWILVLAFTADEIEHEARWRFEPKKLTLSPDNVEAATLSQQGTPAALTPRLRAIDPTAPVDVIAAGSATGQSAASGSDADESGTEAASEETGHADGSGADRPIEPELDTTPTPIHASPVLGSAATAPPVAAAPKPATQAGGELIEGGFRTQAAKPAPAAESDTDTSRFDSAVFQFPKSLTTPDATPVEEEPTPVASRPTTDLLTALSRQRGRRDADVDTGAIPVTEAMRTIGVDAPSDDDEDDDDPFRAPPPIERDTPAPVSRGRFPERLAPSAPKEPLPPLKRPRLRAPRHGSAESTRPAPERAAKVDEAATINRPVAVPPPAPEPTPVRAPRPRRGRTTMPSWDEIVYGKDEE